MDETVLRSIRDTWSNAWGGLDDTPLMPESKADPSYGGREHRMIASAPQTILMLLSEIERLRA